MHHGEEFYVTFRITFILVHVILLTVRTSRAPRGHTPRHAASGPLPGPGLTSPAWRNQKTLAPREVAQ